MFFSGSLADRHATDLTLSVPFKGEIKLPQENYRQAGGSTTSFCPLALSVVGLDAPHGQLAITVAVEGGGQTVLLFTEPIAGETATPGK